MKLLQDFFRLRVGGVSRRDRRAAARHPHVITVPAPLGVACPSMVDMHGSAGVDERAAARWHDHGAD